MVADRKGTWQNIHFVWSKQQQRSLLVYICFIQRLGEACEKPESMPEKYRRYLKTTCKQIRLRGLAKAQGLALR